MNHEGNYQRYATKVWIRNMLRSEGLTPDDLKRTYPPTDPHVEEALHFMSRLRISIADIKQGTPFEDLEPGKNIYGEDIKEGENVYGQNILQLEEEKRQRAAAANLDAIKRREEMGRHNIPRCHPMDNPAFAYAFYVMDKIDARENKDDMNKQIDAQETD